MTPQEKEQRSAAMLHKALKKYYGYDSFRPGQYDLIRALLLKRDVLGIMPTGAGKSICYQIPAVFMEGITIIVSPLISLMKDQVDALMQTGIPAAYLNSSLSFEEFQQTLKLTLQGHVKLLYVAPERLLTPDFLEFSQQIRISMIAVDEAHCVSHWGQNFRPAYLDIARFARSLPIRPVMAAFTATATDLVQKDITALLDLSHPKVLKTTFDRPNLRFEVLQPKNKFKTLLSLIEKHPCESGIVYCSTRKEVDEVHQKLTAEGVRAGAYHAGMEDSLRERVQDDFLYDRISVIVATNAFGMGIDKSNVRYVIHYSMPSSLENYYQEAGRAGRDGEAAQCTLLFAKKDIQTQKFLIEQAPPETPPEQIEMDRHRLYTMVDYCQTDQCLRSFILNYFGEDSPLGCGNCSNCDKEWVTRSVFEEASTIHAALTTLPHAYGLSLLVDFFKGSASKRILSSHLDEYEGYGFLRSKSREEIESLLSQLRLQGYLCRSQDQYHTFSASEKLNVAIEHRMPIQIRSSQKLSPALSTLEKEERADSPLLDLLRDFRKQKAAEQHCPPYIIFGDAALFDLVRRMPETEEELLDVKGFGPKRVSQIGDEILQIIRSWKQENSD